MPSLSSIVWFVWMHSRIWCILLSSLPDIMAIVCHNQRNSRILGQADQRRIDQLLLPNPVILQLQKKVAVPENIPIAQGCLFCAWS